jgi:hypothetical protein
MSRTPEPPPIRPRWTTGTILAAVALVAANVALVSQIVRDTGSWEIAAMMLGTNAFLCLLLGVAVRFRLIPLLAMFSTAALTETMLWQVAFARRNTDWIVAVAVLGGAVLLAVEIGLKAARKARSRHD